MHDHHFLSLIRQRLANNQPVVVAGDFIEAGVLMAVTAPAEKVPELILTRRAMHLSIHPGEAAFPGGKQDAEDSSLLATALREATEEVAMPAQLVNYAGALDQRITRTGIRVSPFVATVPADIQLSPNLNELDCIYKVPLDFFMDANHLVWIEQEYQAGLRLVPHFYYQEHCIMGVTALMIIDLINTVFDIDLRVS